MFFNCALLQAQIFQNYSTLSTSTTLCNDEVRGVCIDDEGRKWFATSQGISVYDGTNWETYSTHTGLKSDAFYCIAKDSKGTIWVGSHNSLFSYDGSDWATYELPLNGLVSSITGIAFDSADNIWISTYGGGAYKFDGENWTNYTETDGLVVDFLTCVVVDEADNVWFGSAYNQKGVSKFDGTTWTSYTDQDGLISADIYCIHVEKGNKIWFGTYNGYSVKDGSTWKSDYTNDIVNDLALDDEGTIWLALNNKGLCKITSTGKEYMDIKDGLRSSQLRALALDKNGAKWIGTFNSGVIEYDNSTFKAYLPNGLTSNVINDVAVDADDNKWLATNAGLVKFDGNTWEFFDSEDGMAGNSFEIVEIDSRGRLWVGSLENGVSLFANGAWRIIDTHAGELKNSGVRSISFDKAGNPWFGTYKGVFVFNGLEWTHYTEDNGLTANDVYDIEFDVSGSAYVAVNGGNACFFNGVMWSEINEVQSTRVICVDANNDKWFGHLHGFGLSRYSYPNVVKYPYSSELPLGWVNDIVNDNDKRLWFGSGSGFSIYHEGKWKNYSKSHGLPGYTVKSIEFDAIGDGWLGTINGLSHCHFNKYKIDFVDYDGEVISSQVIYEDETLLEPQAPARDGYVFIDWDTDFSDVKSDLTITAQYRQKMVPVANFTADHVEGDISFAVQFTDASTNTPTSWSWDFNGDGIEDSKEQNPQYTYSTPGSYTVSLTVSNVDGSNSLTKEDYITVNDLCTNINTNRVSEFKIFPNPSGGTIYLQGVERGASYFIYNLIGTIVQQGIFNGEKLNLNSLNAGIYILEVDEQVIKITKE